MLSVYFFEAALFQLQLYLACVVKNPQQVHSSALLWIGSLC